VKVTSKGKLLRRRAGGNHLLEKKSASRKRSINGGSVITGKLANNIKRALGNVKRGAK